MYFAFDRATAVSHLGDLRYAGTIEEGWDINGNANGGYLLALVASALRSTAQRLDPISVTGHFLAPGRPGPVVVETNQIRAGRQLATVSGTLFSGDRAVLHAIGSFGDVASMTGGFAHVTKSAPDLPPVERCVRRLPDQGVVSIPLVSKLTQALRPEHAGFGQGHRAGEAIMEGWAAFADDRPIDTLALLLILDAFPPPVFHLAAPEGWVPTVELTAHVRAVPAPGAVRCRFTSEVIQNGFLQEDGEVWDSTGTLVAQSRQLALLPRG